MKGPYSRHPWQETPPQKAGYIKIARKYQSSNKTLEQAGVELIPAQFMLDDENLPDDKVAADRITAQKNSEDDKFPLENKKTMTKLCQKRYQTIRKLPLKDKKAMTEFCRKKMLGADWIQFNGQERNEGAASQEKLDNECVPYEEQEGVNRIPPEGISGK